MFFVFVVVGVVFLVFGFFSSFSSYKKVGCSLLMVKDERKSIKECLSLTLVSSFSSV